MSTYISYSSLDKIIVKKLVDELISNGIDVWFDDYEVLPGDTYKDKTLDGIKKSDYILVILSRHSVQSEWVKKEIADAFSKNREVSSKRIIPVKIDDTPIPPFLTNIKYVDLNFNWQSGTHELLSTLLRHYETEQITEKILDPNRLADEIANQKLKFKGSGYLTTTILSILTLLITFISSIPSFQQAFGDKSKVYYSVSIDKMSIPPDIDNAKFQEILKNNNIPDGTIRIDIINAGDAGAKNIKIGINVPGKIIYTKTEPPEKPESIWVRIKTEHDFENYPSNVKFLLENLIPTKKVSTIIGYYSPNSQEIPIVDAIYDSKPAIKVNSIESVQNWSYLNLFQLPIKIFIFGLLITIIIGLVPVIRTNSKIRDALLLIFKELNPNLAKIADVIVKLNRMV